jgi:hypothetical protein
LIFGKMDYRDKTDSTTDVGMMYYRLSFTNPEVLVYGNANAKSRYGLRSFVFNYKRTFAGSIQIDNDLTKGFMPFIGRYNDRSLVHIPPNVAPWYSVD